MTAVASPRVGATDAKRLGISVDQDNDHVTIHVAGEIDIATSGRLRQIVSDCLRNYVTDVSIDMNAVEFIDSSGLRAILASKKLADGFGVSMRIVSPSVSVTKLLELTSLYDRLVA